MVTGLVNEILVPKICDAHQAIGKDHVVPQNLGGDHADAHQHMGGDHVDADANHAAHGRSSC